MSDSLKSLGSNGNYSSYDTGKYFTQNPSFMDNYFGNSDGMGGTEIGSGSSNAMGYAGTAVAAGQLGLGFLNYEAQKEAFDYNKKLTTNKFNASADQYNAKISRYNNINQNITKRRQGLGEVNASYTDKKQIAKM